ncbi:hypothetical protein F4604DRAFT_1787914 [Suillus subluteus]|nr:hypothetical protein F4604DRAFT_1787914 [Suillus subluteus]
MMMVSTSTDIIPRDKTTLVEQCRTDIDKDIAALVASLSILRSRRNTLASVFSLPPEILVMIFTYTAEDANFNIYADIIPRSTGTPTSMIVTHVCRHWRQVALECPSLWTFIDHLPVPWIAIMLERSKEAALVVKYSIPPTLECYIVGPLVQLLSQLPRIEVLKLHTYSNVVHHVFDCLSSQPAPLLQQFRYDVLGSYEPVTTVSETIFQGHAPLLRSVELDGCIFILTSRTFSGLQTLDLKQYDPPHLTLSQILSALRRMPDLELLALRLLRRISVDTELFDQVPLTRLRNLALDGCQIQNAVSLFSHLVLPVDVKIALSLTEIESPQSLSDLFSAIHKDPDGSFPIIRSLCASFSHNTVGVQFSTSLAHKSEYSLNIRDSDKRLSIQLRGFSNPAIIFDMCRMVPHCKIQGLSISTSLRLSQNFWCAGFADLLELESIYLKGTPISGFILALTTAGVSVAYPFLRTLELESIDIGSDEHDGLQEIARRRAKGGVDIQKLRLTGCWNVTEANVQLLESVIGDVDWDPVKKS